jgi:uncharacterized protein YggE
MFKHLLCSVIILLSISSAWSQITVTGQAQSYKFATEAELLLAITSLDADAHKAFENAEDLAQDLVEEYYQEEKLVKGVQLLSTQVSRVYDRENMTYAHQAVKQIRVKVDSLAILEELTEDLLKDGANQLISVKLLSANQTQTLKGLRDLAIVNARQKATAMAKTAQANLGVLTGLEIVKQPQAQSEVLVEPLTNYKGVNGNKIKLTVTVKATYALAAP